MKLYGEVTARPSAHWSSSRKAAAALGRKPFCTTPMLRESPPTGRVWPKRVMVEP